ncbi:histidine kinase [Pedobacter yulinensis]|uniref:histidine kinase n=1 Tax=Pedobacter yulinensis TaxID=2126353 RepID=A0A2T3HJW9_9SPHI|nr:HAMP domain-containing sensor histidine kinase [Pedobacter yulinensis]PST82755.1 histidine kinase [Pedobacter yulinensis]
MHTQLELYQLVAPLAKLGIWERNLVTGEVHWNSIIGEILELKDGSAISLEEVLLLYRNPGEIRRVLDEAMRTGQPQSIEAELVTASGNSKHVQLHAGARLENGRCTRIYGTLRDISEIVSMRHRYEDREARFFQAFNHAPIGMALVSLQGEWLQANHSLCQLMGFTEAELLQRTFQELTHPEDLQADLIQMQQLIANNLDWYEMEKRYFHKDGHVIWALLKVSAVRDQAGKPLYFISQIKDITERKKNTETIKKQNERLLNFAHIVSHNLRSHTGNIKMLSDMVIEERDPLEKEALLGMLSQNAGNLLDTLFHLNEVVKINDTGFSNRQALNLKREIDRVLTILSASIIQAEASITLAVNPDLELLLNPAYLESILVNLISNSIRYRDAERSLQVNIAADTASDKTTLRITDNGSGIDLNLHGKKLFGMYKTFHGNDDARGMGLFLVKNQVEAMDGKVFVESVPGQGTTFTLEFTHR